MSIPSPFIRAASEVRPRRSRSRPSCAQRPCRAAERVGVSTLPSEKPNPRAKQTTSQRVGYAALVITFLLIELYATGQICVQLAKVPVQVKLNFDPPDIFQCR
jgi:hypothetical protein